VHRKINRIERVESWDDPNLAGSRLKLARATELFMALQWESMQFRLDGQLVELEDREEADDLGNMWMVSYCTSVAKIPLRLSLLTGDIVHNLRSALDHALYQLVLRDGGKPTTKTQWPVFTETPAGRSLSRYNAQLKGIKDEDVRRMIDWFQPYQPHRNRIHENLTLIHDLDIIDKHHLVRPGVAIATDAKPSPVLLIPEPVQVGNEVFRVSEGSRIGVAAIQYELAFWEAQVTTQRINGLVETVQGVIDKVGVFFSPQFFIEP
jgi:hypothetical protein